MIASTVGPQTLEKCQHFGHIRRGQRGGGFVENQHLRLARERLGDFHHLLARQR